MNPEMETSLQEVLAQQARRLQEQDAVIINLRNEILTLKTEKETISDHRDSVVREHLDTKARLEVVHDNNRILAERHEAMKGKVREALGDMK